MLINRKVFTILCLLCLCGNREYPGSFLKKAVSSYFKRVPSKVREEAFLKWTRVDLSSNLLHMGIMLTIIKVFIILFLLCLWEQGTPRQFSKQIINISFQLSFQISSLLAQTEGERKVFFGGCKKEDHIVRLYPRALGCLSFCEI